MNAVLPYVMLAFLAAMVVLQALRITALQESLSSLRKEFFDYATMTNQSVRLLGRLPKK
jgi:hypothetical protein